MAVPTTRNVRARRVLYLAIVIALVTVVIVVASRDRDSPGTASPTFAPATSALVPATAPTTTPTTTPTVATTAPASTVPPNPGGDLVAVGPTRLVDTRTGLGATGGQAGKASLVTASIAGRAGGATAAQIKAVALNVTIAEPSQSGYLTVAAAGTRPSDVSQIAFVNTTASSLIVTRANSEGMVELRLSDGATSHIIVDLVGYFSTARSPDNLSVIPEPLPVAMVDTRTSAPIEPAKTLDVTLAAPQSGAVLGITATGARGTGFLTVFGGGARPDTSALNFGIGHDATALTIVATSADRVVHIYNGSTAPVHVVVFQIARLVRGAPADGLALNIEGTVAQDGRSAPFPFRTVDTRGNATCANTVGGGVSSIATIFPKARALLVSITVVNASVASYMTAYSGSAQPPGMATLNFDAREVRSNLAFVPVSGDRVNLVCGGGNPEYILDVLATLE